MSKWNKHTRKIKITEQNLIGLDEIIASIPTNLHKSLVLYITTWQEKPDEPQEFDTMITKPEWFKQFEEDQNRRWEKQEKFNEAQEKRWEDQNKRWEEQCKFNEKILSLVESLVQRVENIEKRLDGLESRIENLVVKNNLKE